MNIIAIIQARVGSTRFPNKVMKEVAGKPLIQHLLDRLSKSEFIDKIVLGTSTSPENDEMDQYVSSLGFDVFRGSENDVLDRYYQAAKQFQPDVVVRITGDCPLIDYQVTDKVIQYFLDNDFDYVSNIDPPTFPDGLDTEVFTFEALEKAWEKASQQHEREHVTPFIRESGLFKTGNVTNDVDLSAERWTVDEREDYELIKIIIEELGKNDEYFGTKDILAYKKANPELFEINKNINRDEGMSMNSGAKLWNRAKKVIPGGNMLLSKRAEMFLPEKWPAYYKKAKGCTIWDLDDNQYIDMSIMGIGTNILGYANDEVDEAVRKVIDTSNTSTFNCPEEVCLAEKLVELHPWAQMVRFARTGGEACSIAIRIARAASGKDKVAFCGYHGWHDWYLSANLSEDSNLDGHLLPGLEPNGVPRNLKDTAIPFTYNKIGELETAIQNHDIGIIIMEVIRNYEPEDDFLEKVRDLATGNNIVLIFDEITSGFRQNVGGIHLTYGVNPDMAVFGKAVGNGYAISAVIGKKEVMEHAQSSFISSTFWTERIGSVAALKTIEIMERDNVPELITEYGHYINKSWEKLGANHGFNLDIGGLPSLTHFNFGSSNELIYKTLITQEMLKKGYLAANSVYVCKDHTKEIVDGYLVALDDVFLKIKQIDDGAVPDNYLEGPVCHSGFKRLN